MSWKVYIIYNQNYSYCGATPDIDKRIRKHNQELPGGAKYTRSRSPCRYIHTEVCESRSDASKKEYKFKKLTRNKKKAYMNYLLCSGGM